jgi:hypothetical protein
MRQYEDSSVCILQGVAAGTPLTYINDYLAVFLQLFAPSDCEIEELAFTDDALWTLD